MKAMKLSIITITLNNIAGLKATAQSIHSQSFKDYEWIVIDGGSEDGSTEYIKNIANRLSYWCSEKDSGIYNAMNKGINVANGEYLLFLNSGDTLHSEKTLEEVFVKEYSTDILYGNTKFIHPKHSYIRCFDDPLTLKALYYCSINHQSTFIRSSLLKDVGYDEKYRIVADWKKFVEWFKDGRTFRHLNLVIADYDMSGISTLNQELLQKEKDRFWSELYSSDVIDVLKDWETFQNKPCLQTRAYCLESRLFRRIIRTNLHIITWIRKIFC